MLTLAYNALGNITNKDGNAYSYGAGSAGPHAVTSAYGSTYSYNANGSMISGDGRSISYTVFGKPVEITQGSRTVDLHYGPNRNRYLRIDNENTGSETTTHYIGSVERTFRANGDIDTQRYVDGELIVTETESGGAYTTDVLVVLKDHLGSTDLLANEAGAIVQAMSFDAWGKRRAPDDYCPLTGSVLYNFDTSNSRRGFTGHEGLDPVGLIHMNGRVYDPKLARFSSADPFLQAPSNTQSHNRYTYVFNNPLSYTDPSGYFGLKDALSIAIGIAGFALCGPCSSSVWASIAVGAGTGAIVGAIQSGSLGGALMGAFSGALFGALGVHYGEWSADAILSFGIAGGITSVMQGGRFGHGFISAVSVGHWVRVWAEDSPGLLTQSLPMQSHGRS